jgi:hypothetical protein
MKKTRSENLCGRIEQYEHTRHDQIQEYFPDRNRPQKNH